MLLLCCLVGMAEMLAPVCTRGGIVLEFWEACIHQYLYVRRVYPETLFVQQMLYGAHVWFSPQPDINKYVKRVIKNASVLLDAAIADRLELTVVSSQTNEAMEWFFLTAPSLQDLPYDEDSCDKLEGEMRAALLKIVLMGSVMRALPDGDNTFTLALATKQCNGTDDRGAIDAALRGGEWKNENGENREAFTEGMTSVLVKTVGSMRLLFQTLPR